MSSTIKNYTDYVMTGFVKAVAPIVIEEAYGTTVRAEDGREYLDCFSGISVVSTGHCNPEIVAAAKTQLEKLIHCSSYLYHVKPVADLAAKIAGIAPPGLTKTFFANSGAEAIEGAMKLARLYTGKREFIALQGSFHGRTWGALSVTGNVARKKGAGPYAAGVSFAPAPYAYRSKYNHDPEAFARRCAEAIEDIIRFNTSGEVAAFIAEPIMGEGGIIVPAPNYFRLVKEVLDKHRILFIADEVQTGFARTGPMFAMEHYGVTPDILVTAKGIASGFPLSAFTTTPEIAAAFKPGDHLSTFGGNPVSCAAALATIRFIERERLPDHVERIGQYALAQLEHLARQFPMIGELRGKGLMIGIELVRNGSLPAPEHAELVREALLREGVLVGVGGIFGNVVRVQPPLIIQAPEIDRVVTALARALSLVH